MNINDEFNIISLIIINIIILILMLIITAESKVEAHPEDSTWSKPSIQPSMWCAR